MAFKTYIKISFNLLLWLVVLVGALNYSTVIYLYFQAKGQMNILIHKQSFEEFRNKAQLSPEELDNLELINKIKRYSVDSLAFKATSNYNEIYDQNKQPLLWVISASGKYKISPYKWHFPLLGYVSYKGFFDKQKAISEKNHLVSLGYDVDLRSVSAWSTLGWFNDPVLSSMLTKQKGNLCNLIFHELFHATYYAPSSVDFNENLASFIAHQATIQYLKNDTINLKFYLSNYNNNQIINKHINYEIGRLNLFYDSISNLNSGRKSILKMKKMNEICTSLNSLPLVGITKIQRIQKEIMSSKNAWFVDFEQYNSLQDSLEQVFNKNYKSNLMKMVQSLK